MISFCYGDIPSIAIQAKLGRRHVREMNDRSMSSYTSLPIISIPSQRTLLPTAVKARTYENDKPPHN